MVNPEIIRLVIETLWLVLILSAPPILAASAIGLIVALFQAATQLQEQTTQFALKFIAIVVSIFLMSGFAGGALMRFGDYIFSNFHTMTG